MVQGNLPKISEEVKPKYKKFTELMQVIFAPPPPSRDAPDQLDKVISKPFYQCETPDMKDKEIFVKNAEENPESNKLKNWLYTSKRKVKLP